MVQRIVLFIVAGAVALGGASCKKSQKDVTAEKQAKFRADQKAKAIARYQELVKKYPDSEYAEKAKERIRALGPVATPKKK